jgi:CDP-diacylglycerol--serine O-phosphatidyltransferase
MSADKKKRNYRAIVPNFFTISNMFCGFTSVIYSFNGDFLTAFWLIILGSVFDVFDGKIARYMETASEFGVEYDSFSDVITFGVAPSFMIYNAFYNDMNAIGFLIAFMPLLFGSIRLARFNIELEGFDKEEFSGLPIPLAAITVSSGVLFWLEFMPVSQVNLHWFTALMIAVVGLEVTRFRYPTLPNFALKHARRSDRIAVVILLAAAVAVIIWQNLMLFPVLLLISFSGVIRWFYEWFKDGGTRSNHN